MKLLIILYALLSSVYCMEKEKNSQEFHIYTSKEDIKAHLKEYPAICWLRVALDENFFLKPDYKSLLNGRWFYLEKIFSQGDTGNIQNEPVIHKNGKTYYNVKKLLEKEKNNDVFYQMIAEVQQLIKNDTLTHFLFEDEQGRISHAKNYICNLQSPIELLLLPIMPRESFTKKIETHNQKVYFTEIKQISLEYSKKYPITKYLINFIPEKYILGLTRQSENNKPNHQLIGTVIITYLINKDKTKSSSAHINFLNLSENIKKNSGGFFNILLNETSTHIKKRNTELPKENKIKTTYLNFSSYNNFPSKTLKEIACINNPQDFFMHIL